MDGIQTKVYCPECKKEVSIFLAQQKNLPDMFVNIFKTFGLPIGNEMPYKGETECSCGKTVRATFVMEAVSKDAPQMQRVVIGGRLPQ